MQATARMWHGFQLSGPSRATSATRGKKPYSTCFGTDDGSNPDYGDLVFDPAGNLYGTTRNGGAYLQGAVYELSPHRRQLGGKSPAQLCRVARWTLRHWAVQFSTRPATCMARPMPEEPLAGERFTS